MIFKNCYLITADDDFNIFKNGAFKIKNKKFKQIGNIEDINIEKDEKIIDLEGDVVIPGLINTHTHIPMILFRGLADDLKLKKWLEEYIWPMEKKMIDKDFIKWGTLLGMMEMIKTGTTTFSDMYFYEGVVAEEVKNANMRAVLGEGVIDFPTPDAEGPERNIKRFKNLYKKWKDDRNIFISMCAHSPYTCSKDLLKKTKDLADEYEVLYHIHVAETKTEKNIIKDNDKKISPFKYLKNLGILDENVLMAHAVWPEKGDFKIIKDNSVKISHNLSSNLKLASGIAPVPDYLKENITVSLGTDGAASNNTLNLFNEMRLAALVHKGYNLNPTTMNVKDVLKMATVDGAKSLLLEDKIGSISKNKYADFVVIDRNKINFVPGFNPLSDIIYSSSGYEVKTTYVGGQKIYEEGEYFTINKDKVFENVNKIKEKIKDKV